MTMHALIIAKIRYLLRGMHKGSSSENRTRNSVQLNHSDSTHANSDAGQVSQALEIHRGWNE